MAESDINVDTAAVGAIASDVSSKYSSIASDFSRLAYMYTCVGNYWEATEATAFAEQLATVNSKYENFTTQYNAFMDSLSQFTGDYDELEEDIASAIESYNGSTGGN